MGGMRCEWLLVSIFFSGNFGVCPLKLCPSGLLEYWLPNAIPCLCLFFFVPRAYCSEQGGLLLMCVMSHTVIITYTAICSYSSILTLSIDTLYIDLVLSSPKVWAIQTLLIIAQTFIHLSFSLYSTPVLYHTLHLEFSSLTCQLLLSVCV